MQVTIPDSSHFPPPHVLFWLFIIIIINILLDTLLCKNMEGRQTPTLLAYDPNI